MGIGTALMAMDDIQIYFCVSILYVDAGKDRLVTNC